MSKPQPTLFEYMELLATPPPIPLAPAEPVGGRVPPHLWRHQYGDGVVYPRCLTCRDPLDRCDLLHTVPLCERCATRREARLRPELRG